LVYGGFPLSARHVVDGILQEFGLERKPVFAAASRPAGEVPMEE
jgi:hypothetical protein